MRYSFSNYLHYTIQKQLIDCKTLIDMGGTGKMKNRRFTLTNANIRKGIDGTNLPFSDSSFDASMSVVVLEHVGSEEKQIQFINESIRVAKKRILHWIPIDQGSQDLLTKIGHKHPCILPSKKIMKYLNKNFQQIDCMTVREHLLCLSVLYPNLICDELYKYVYVH